MSLIDAIDKNQAVIDYLITCPKIINSPLYFNFINAEDDSTQLVTQSNDKFASKYYIDGSVSKLYTLTIITYKSAADIAVVKASGYPNENVSDMSDIQMLIDWIQEQEEAKNYPNFGETCIIDSITVTSENPVFNGIDDQTSPPLAVYSFTIEIAYLDISKRIWRE